MSTTRWSWGPPEGLPRPRAGVRWRRRHVRRPPGVVCSTVELVSSPASALVPRSALTVASAHGSDDEAVRLVPGLVGAAPLGQSILLVSRRHPAVRRRQQGMGNVERRESSELVDSGSRLALEARYRPAPGSSRASTARTAGRRSSPVLWRTSRTAAARPSDGRTRSTSERGWSGRRTGTGSSSVPVSPERALSRSSSTLWTPGGGIRHDVHLRYRGGALTPRAPSRGALGTATAGSRHPSTDRSVAVTAACRGARVCGTSGCGGRRRRHPAEDPLRDGRRAPAAARPARCSSPAAGRPSARWGSGRSFCRSGGAEPVDRPRPHGAGTRSWVGAGRGARARGS